MDLEAPTCGRRKPDPIVLYDRFPYVVENPNPNLIPDDGGHASCSTLNSSSSEDDPAENGMSATSSSSSSTPRRRDSSPLGRFILDQSRKSLQAVKARAASLHGDSLQQTPQASPGPLASQPAKTGAPAPAALPGLIANRGDAIFENMSYLGCSHMDDPVSEPEMLQIMAQFNAEKLHDSVTVTLVVPCCSSGIVRLLETSSKSEITSFPVHRIRFCARGQPSSPEQDCFALSFTQFTGSNAIHQCHVFRCQFPEAAGKALFCFANAFRNNEPPPLPSGATTPTAQGSPSSSVSDEVPPQSEEDYQFEAFLEIKEEDAKKGFTLCPVEKNCFKLRRDREKRVVVVLRQVSGPRHLAVKKCFGLLLAAGRNLRESDMQLLDMQNMSEGQSNSRVYIVEALWNPNAHNFEVLNTETPKETRVFMTVAVDVILTGIDEPVRFKLECKARIFQQYERFWYVTRKAVVERYFLTIKMDEPSTSIEAAAESSSTNPFKVVRFESIAERERSLTRLNLGGRSPTKMPTQLIHPADDDESDSDEPLLSGSGEVNRVCPEDVLAEWKTLTDKWKEEPEKRPAELPTLINDGIPDVLRGEVWQLLAKVYVDPELVQTYRMLLEKESPSEQVILRDIHRTFPAHDYFKESNGVGQEALYKISKAYSLYDEEVSYCQGLSFLAAALLLHMPEDQAFCVLIKIMFDYGMRDLFKLGFDALHLRFYQLQRLIEDYAPDLFNHFYAIGVETHMYASQWFLTLFTAKFPLQMVFFIIDLFLTEGVNTIFHISLALLQDSKKDLLQLDFEGVLKYFRVTLPRRYRTETSARDLINNAVKLKISHKRLTKYEKEYHTLKQRELESLDPLERLGRENIRLKETILRLERENDDLAHELVTSKIELRNKLDTTEDQLESTVTLVERKTRECASLHEEAKNLREESDILKSKCRLEVERLDGELSQSRNLVQQYKKICRRLEEQAEKFDEEKQQVIGRCSKCEHCSDVVEKWAEASPKHRRANGSTSPRTNGSPSSPEPPPTANGWLKAPATNGSVKIVDLMERLEDREEYIRQVELELAQTKLALVEAQCQNQDLTHQMSTSMNAESDGRPAWLKKTISSIREVSTSLKQQSAHERSNSNVSHSSIDR